ncbi:hypothetical protein A0H81_07289 [Grifola frondosa]|uniref:Uncharacterized protein n=1 Tax=Grifola frondosa TaxID=5627 RepID=A0A1C7M981_GRIFR|nr:hypothetical protein A0H81_07289 [Grifola frondosa]
MHRRPNVFFSHRFLPRKAFLITHVHSGVRWIDIQTGFLRLWMSAFRGDALEHPHTMCQTMHSQQSFSGFTDHQQNISRHVRLPYAPRAHGRSASCYTASTRIED